MREVGDLCSESFIAPTPKGVDVVENQARTVPTSCDLHPELEIRAQHSIQTAIRTSAGISTARLAPQKIYLTVSD
jgi:hypothetical protein